MEGLGSPTDRNPWMCGDINHIPGEKELPICPYQIFYPVISATGQPFPINLSIQLAQGRAFEEASAWRGDIIVIKHLGDPQRQIVDADYKDIGVLITYFQRSYPLFPPSFLH